MIKSIAFLMPALFVAAPKAGVAEASEQRLAKPRAEARTAPDQAPVSRVTPVLTAGALGDETQPTRTILFVDDHDVLYRPGTVRRLRPLARHSQNPMLKRDRPWEKTVGYCSVHRDPETGAHQLWYQAWIGGGCFLCYATSDDGIHWTKPNMGLREYQGSRDNNILLKIGYGAGVLYDPRDSDPDRRYKIAYWEHQGTSVAFSSDGIHWTKHPSNPVIDGSHGAYTQPPFQDDPIIGSGRQGPPLSTSDVIDPQWDPVRQCFMIFSKTWLDGPDGTMHWKRGLVRTDSKDFLDWSPPVLILAPDEWDDPAGESSLARTTGGGGSGGKQIHSGPAFYYNGLYFAQLQVMDPDGTGNMPNELALSRDGYHFSRPFRDTPFLGALDDKTQFDASLLWTNATPIFLDEEFRFYYGAYGRAWNSNDNRQLSGIGLATMPRDRFAGVRPSERIGQITLKPIHLQKIKALTLNAQAEGGAIRVEILDLKGYRVPGYSKDDAKPCVSNSLSQPVAWKAKTLSDLPAGQYKLRIHLDNAEIFALTLMD